MKKLFSNFRDLLRKTPPLLLTFMVLSVIMMNLFANKSIDTGLSWLALDCGILLSWLAFLAMDVMTKCFGPGAATLASVLALVINLFFALIMFIVGHIPGTWGESYVEGSETVINTALNNTMNGTWYIILGSSVAFLVSALVNNFLNHFIGRSLAHSRRDSEADSETLPAVNEKFGGFALRSYVSTFIGQFTDNLIFALIVSRNFFGWSMVQCLTCALTGAVCELLCEVLFSPLGYRISRQILKEQNA